MTALSGKKEGGGELKLQLKTTVVPQLSEEEGEEPMWGEDEEEDEDLRERREEQASLQSEASLSFAVMLKKNATDLEVGAALDQLLAAIVEHDRVKERAFTQIGTAPLIDVLEMTVKRKNLLLKVLLVVNQLAEGSPAIQSMFAIAGGVSTIINLAVPTTELAARLEIARFAAKMSGPSLETLASCRGPQTLVSLLLSASPPSIVGNQLAVTVLKCINNLLALQKGKPCFDVSRSFLRAGLLTALVSTARSLIGDIAICAGVGEVLMSMAASDLQVKEAFCVVEVLSGIWFLTEKGPEPLRVALLKSVRLIASDPANIESLNKSGAIRILVAEMKRSTAVRFNALHALSQLCKLNPDRLGEAAQCGIVPPLIAASAVRAEKEVALPMLCELLMRVKKARDQLWSNNCLEFFIDLLRDRIYQPNALECIANWLNDEPHRVKKTLGHTKQIKKLARAFEKADNVVWPRLVPAYHKIVMKSRGIARKLGREPIFVQTLFAKLSMPQAKVEVRKSLAQILTRLFAVHKEKRVFVQEYELVTRLTQIRRENQTALLVVNIVDDLLAQLKKLT